MNKTTTSMIRKVASTYIDLNNQLNKDLEKKNFFIKRTNRHISLVKLFCAIINEAYPHQFPKLTHKSIIHDASKFNEPEMVPYILITWNYKCKKENIDSGLSHLKNIMTEATEHHVKNNSHHPEYWSSQQTNLINTGNRDDAPTTLIDATKMDDEALAEMCADWCAMSVEMGNTPFEWSDKVIGKRWKFTAKQELLIQDILEKCWKNYKDL